MERRTNSSGQLSLLLAPQPHACSVHVRESPRAKHLSINVSPLEGVEVVVPRRTSPRQVERFVYEHRDWIERATREMALICPRVEALPKEIYLPALDAGWDVRYRRRDGVRFRLRESSGQLELSGPVDDEAGARARLKGWLAALARTHLPAWLDRLGERTGLQYRRVQVRGQRTRWGSCSSQRTISLNYSLLFLERPLVRYLLIHELCHTRYMSHGPRFWGLVARYEPSYRMLDNRLGEAWREVPGWVTL